MGRPRGGRDGRWVVAAVVGLGMLAIVILYFGSLWVGPPKGHP